MENPPFDWDNPEHNVIKLPADEAVSGVDAHTETVANDAVLDETTEIAAQDADYQKEFDIALQAAKLLAAERKSRGAQEKMTDISRKRRFYQALGDRALGREVTITEPGGSTPKAQTWAERFMERRLDGKMDKRNVQLDERKRVVENFGGEATKDTGYKTIGSTDIRIRQAEAEQREGRMTPAQLRTEILMIKGTRGKPTERERIRFTEKEYKANRLTLDELIDEQSKIKSSRGRPTEREQERHKQPNGSQKAPGYGSEHIAQARTRRRFQGAQKKVARAAKQPVASRVRNRRYKKAQKNFEKYSSAAEEHREALRQLDPEHPLLRNNEDDDTLIIDPSEAPTLITSPDTPSDDTDDEMWRPPSRSGDASGRFGDMVPPARSHDELWAEDEYDDPDDEGDDPDGAWAEYYGEEDPEDSGDDDGYDEEDEELDSEDVDDVDEENDDGEPQEFPYGEDGLPRINLRRFRESLGDDEKFAAVNVEEEEPGVLDVKPGKPRGPVIWAASRESAPSSVDPYKVALEYTAYLRGRFGDNVSMSDSSIVKRLAEVGVSEEDARQIYRRMQKEGVVDPQYTKDVGHRVLMDSEQINALLEKK